MNHTNCFQTRVAMGINTPLNQNLLTTEQVRPCSLNLLTTDSVRPESLLTYIADKIRGYDWRKFIIARYGDLARYANTGAWLLGIFVAVTAAITLYSLYHQYVAGGRRGRRPRVQPATIRTPSPNIPTVQSKSTSDRALLCEIRREPGCHLTVTNTCDSCLTGKHVPIRPVIQGYEESPKHGKFMNCAVVAMSAFNQHEQFRSFVENCEGAVDRCMITDEAVTSFLRINKLPISFDCVIDGASFVYYDGKSGVEHLPPIPGSSVGNRIVLANNHYIGYPVDHQVYVHPGSRITETHLPYLAMMPNLFLIPDCSTHADVRTSPYGDIIRKFNVLPTQSGPIEFRHVGDYGDIKLYSVMYCTQEVTVDNPLKQVSVGDKHYIVSPTHTTYVTDVRESVPNSILSDISARLATDKAEPEVLYDRVRTFLSSKLVSNSIKVSDYTPWVIYLVYTVNKSAQEAGPSVRVNLPFNASYTSRFIYNLSTFLYTYLPFSSFPIERVWNYPTVRVPTYEVFTERLNALTRNPFKHEARTPFSIVQPHADATSADQCVSSSGSDDSKCAQLDGTESISSSADTTPHTDFPASHTDDNVDDSLATENCLPVPSNLCDVGARVPGPDVYSVPDCTTRDSFVACTGDTPTDGISIGDATLYLMPVDFTRRNGSTFPGWEVVVGGGHDGDSVKLSVCFECAKNHGYRAINSRQASVYHYLTGLQHRRVDSCLVNQGTLAGRFAAQAPSAPVRQGEVSATNEDSYAGAAAIRRVGVEVPLSKKRTIARRKSRSSGKRFSRS